MTQEVNESKPCDNCGTLHTNDGSYCSISCGYRDKIANEYHCPVCNEVTYSLDCDPYCSNSHRKHDVDKYDYYRSCRVCGSMFHGTKFDYTCSDYCKERDDYGV